MVDVEDTFTCSVASDEIDSGLVFSPYLSPPPLLPSYRKLCLLMRPAMDSIAGLAIRPWASLSVRHRVTCRHSVPICHALSRCFSSSKTPFSPPPISRAVPPSSSSSSPQFSSSSHPLPLSELTAISPIDGRYASICSPLRSLFSEYGLIEKRATVEIRWLQMLAKHHNITQFPALSPSSHFFCDSLLRNFSLSDAQRVKAIEATTKHDMKAVEYFLKEKFALHPDLQSASEWLHFACTSEDVNNLAYGLMLLEAKATIILPMLDRVIAQLRGMAQRWAHIPMLSRTHGQPATPTTVGKEMANFAYRLGRQRKQLAACEVLGKMNGAVGNYNAHVVAYPKVDWVKVTRDFVEGELGLVYNPYTTQIEPHDFLAEHFDCLHRFNSIMLDLSRDMWGYISLGYFRQRTEVGEVGSSTMPHKVNPIDFENCEGNLGLSNALLSHMAHKLQVSRWQRDLSDSTVLRCTGMALSHAYLAAQSALKGMGKVEVDEGRVREDLEGMWEVLGEAYQTVMRREGVDQPYEKLKEMTWGKKVGPKEMKEFIDTLEVSDEVKSSLRELTPSKYTGLAEKLAKEV